jgi:hypothetical protein
MRRHCTAAVWRAPRLKNVAVFLYQYPVPIYTNPALRNEIPTPTVYIQHPSKIPPYASLIVYWGVGCSSTPHPTKTRLGAVDVTPHASVHCSLPTPSSPKQTTNNQETFTDDVLGCTICIKKSSTPAQTQTQRFPLQPSRYSLYAYLRFLEPHPAPSQLTQPPRCPS